MSRHVLAIILYIWIFVIDLETTVFESECSYAKAAVHMEDVASASLSNTDLFCIVPNSWFVLNQACLLVHF